MNTVIDKSVIVTSDSVLSAIRDFLDSNVDRNHFTTRDIAIRMGADEYPVRAAVSWLVRYGLVEVVPGVRSRRYLGQPKDPSCRRHTDSYSASVYQLCSSSSGEADFNALMSVFCRG